MELHPEDGRLTTFPIHRPTIWKYYEDAQRMYWVPAEVSLSRDVNDFEKLTNNEKKYIKHILAFFATSDGIVNINLAQRFKQEIPILEVGYFYDYQMMIENVHAHMYSILIDTLIKDLAEKQVILSELTTMAEFIFKCVDSNDNLANRLLRMACVEGIFFTGCFCAIYWLQNRGLMPGLGHSNELISRDEALHTMFALHLYWMLPPISTVEIYGIFDEAVQIACKFIETALPDDLSEMNSTTMKEYIKSQADNLLSLIDTPKLYNSKNPYLFMEQINLQNHTNFFERRVSEYSKSTGQSECSVPGQDPKYEIMSDF